MARLTREQAISIAEEIGASVISDGGNGKKIEFFASELEEFTKRVYYYAIQSTVISKIEAAVDELVELEQDKLRQPVLVAKDWVTFLEQISCMEGRQVDGNLLAKRAKQLLGKG